ncbi:hypothetical protein FMM05_16970 [Flavobacterium zepuense]|uniref:Uncharacterized protein n=1 Tax=Flavobacterium zepuense TaxID=2593302 RepID=A0A552UWF5_9FLAO|nr:hypothetical protein [Flavobacterium zepuense]TRW22572.1 hypothetical protein FMM05_16970 [Flavobacterium zepuense]
MSLLLYINGQLADLDAGQTIAQTKQVNDLNSLDNRQASYTNKFKLPKTATNVKIMEYLTVTGNNSNVPYQKNECSLFSETGECFVYNGWAMITDGGNDYEAVIYDGIVSLYKKIENQTLANLELADDLNHTKTLANVMASWSNPNTKYKYIMANYNGATHYIPPSFPPQLVVNVDYLLPSVNVSWLWQKVFTQYGFTYSGSVFNSEDFTNLWVTYPKGVATSDLNVSQLESDTILYHTPATVYNTIYYVAFTGNPVTNLLSFNSNIFCQVAQTGKYRLNISGKITTSGAPTKMYLAKNTSNLSADYAPQFKNITHELDSGTDFSRSVLFDLQAGDSVAIVIRSADSAGQYYLHHDECELTVNLELVGGKEIDFQGAFENFSIRDFVNEVIYRFGLTLYKRKDDNHYDFLTLQEQLQTPQLQNWSSRFVRKTAEKYTFSNYAQQNYLRYAYNNKDDSYHDAAFAVNNANLDDTKDIFKSKIYAPEKDHAMYLGTPSNIYKMWDKDVNVDAETGQTNITYKPLDSRFYFLKSTVKQFGSPIKIGSKEYNTSQLIYSCPIESFYKLPFTDVVQDYYTPLNAISDKAQIVTAEFWLTDNDIANFDFKKLYYLEQLSSYFIMNKINNYIPGKPTKCDLVRVQYTGEAQPYLALTHIQINGLATTSYNVSSFGNTTIILQYYQHYNDTAEIVWQNATGGTQSPIPLTFPFAGTFTVRLWCNGLTSNTITITLPSNQTIYA